MLIRIPRAPGSGKLSEGHAKNSNPKRLIFYFFLIFCKLTQKLYHLMNPQPPLHTSKTRVWLLQIQHLFPQKPKKKKKYTQREKKETLKNTV